MDTIIHDLTYATVAT